MLTTHKDTSAAFDLAAAVTKDDANDLATAPTRGLYVGGTGNVAVIMAADNTSGGAGTAVTFSGVAAGTVLPIRVRRVMSTNTTATGIVALY
jgi:hypothetical protein